MMMGVYTIRPIVTKGTDAFLHGGQVKEAQTSEEESKENRILYFCNVSMTVTPNTTLSGTLL